MLPATRSTDRGFGILFGGLGEVLRLENKAHGFLESGQRRHGGVEAGPASHLAMFAHKQHGAALRALGHKTDQPAAFGQLLQQ